MGSYVQAWGGGGGGGGGECLHASSDVFFWLKFTG